MYIVRWFGCILCFLGLPAMALDEDSEKYQLLVNEYSDLILARGHSCHPSYLACYLDNADPNRIGALFSALNKNPAINSLSITLLNMGNQGGIALADGIKANFTLKKLHLKENDIGEEGFMAIVEALKLNTTINFLDFWGGKKRNGTNDTRFLAKVINEACSIEYIAVGEVRFDDQGCKAIVEAFESNLTIKGYSGLCPPNPYIGQIIAFESRNNRITEHHHHRVEIACCVSFFDVEFPTELINLIFLAYNKALV